MKILFDSTFLRNKHTGVDVYFLSLIPQILDLDTKNDYIILVDKRYDTNYLLSKISKFKNFTILKIYSPLPLQVLYSSFFIPFYLRIKKIDVYHNPFFFGPLFKFVCPSTKIVITAHDMYHRTIPQMMNKYLNVVFKIFADNAMKIADEIIVISDQTKTDVKKYLNIAPDKLTLIHQAPRSDFDTHPDEKGNLSKFELEDKNFIFTVGKILPSKGLDDLIRSFEMFINRYNIRDVFLVSAGSKEHTHFSTIQNLIQDLNVDAYVKILGYITDNEMYQLYNKANMVVVPSHYEGFGLPVLEAMKFGCPVIARNASSLVEIVGDAGMLFNSCDDLASKINTLFHDAELRENLIAKGFERVKDFSWEATAQKTIAVYNKN